MTETFVPTLRNELDIATPITGEAVRLSVRPTSFVLRAAGALIDIVVSLIVLLGLFIVLWSAAGAGMVDESTASALSIVVLVFSVVVLPTGIELMTHGRSLGKLAIGARIVRNDGGPIGFRHAVTRSLVGLIDFYLSFGGLAAILGLVSDRSRRLGDMLAGTYSQHERVPRIRRVPPVLPPELADWASVADVARLPENLARRMSAFLEHSAGYVPQSRAALAAALVAEAAPYVSPMPQADPETVLRGIAVLRRDRDTAALALRRRRLDALDPLLTGEA